MSELPGPRAHLAAMLAECEAAWSQWPEEKRSSLLRVMQAVLACYLKVEDHRAVMLLTHGRGEDECISLLTMNAQEGQVQELVDTLCVLRRLEAGSAGGLLH